MKKTVRMTTGISDVVDDSGTLHYGHLLISDSFHCPDEKLSSYTFSYNSPLFRDNGKEVQS